MASILLIEDDQSVADAILFLLQERGWTVVHSSDRESAEKLLMRKVYDLIITDVWLDKDDGLDLLKSMRAEGLKTPVIVISGGGPGRTLENVTARADAYGAIGILYKPFGNDELISLVKQALGKSA